MLKVLSAGMLVIALSGCTTARIDRFKALGDLGQSYERTVDTIIAKSQTAQIDANSATLLAARELAQQNGAWLAGTDPLDVVEKANTFDKETLDGLNRLRDHAHLLERYFSALSALAAFGGESAITSSAGEAAEALVSLSPKLASAKIGGAAIPQLIEAVAPLIVARLKSRPLEAELRQHGRLILAHLEWQQRLLNFLGDRIAADGEVLAERSFTRNVYDPYADLNGPAAGFTAARREYLLAPGADAAPAREAAKLAANIRTAMIALAEGRIEAIELGAYARDLARIVDLADALGAGRERR